MNVQIYHNPRCSKSRQTLELIQNKGIEPQINLYLENSPTVEEIGGLLSKLGIPASGLVRKKEDLFKELKLQEASETELLKAMSEHPKLIERPIVVVDNKAILGRPPENINEIL